jgi:hypothetical protein
MSNPGFASLTAGMLVRKGDAKPSQEPMFGSIPWSAPKAQTAAQTAATAAVNAAAAAAADAAGTDIAAMKVRLADVAATWPARKPHPAEAAAAEGAWVPTKTAPPAVEAHAATLKTTIRLTHAQARAVKLAALVLDRPQQDILSYGLLAQLEALACTDLANCSCFKAVIAGLGPAESVLTPDK